MDFNQRIFASEEEYQQCLARELEESMREANDPNTRWLTQEEFWASVEDYLLQI